MFLWPFVASLAIKNSVSNDFLSMFVNDINVLDCRLSGASMNTIVKRELDQLLLIYIVLVENYAIISHPVNDALQHSQKIFSHVGTSSWVEPVLYINTEDKVSCSMTQHGASGEARTS